MNDTDKRISKALDRWKNIDKRSDYPKTKTFTFKCNIEMFEEFVKLSKKLGYLNKSEHMRELIRYELETYADMIAHKVIK